MFSFNQPILLMSIRTRNPMHDPNLVKEFMQFLIFPSLIGLISQDFWIKSSFSLFLKLNKNLLNFRFVLLEINLIELAIVIYETTIIFITIDRWSSWTPHVGMNKFKRFQRYTSRQRKRKLVWFFLLTGITHRNIRIIWRRNNKFICLKNVLNNWGRWVS